MPPHEEISKAMWISSLRIWTVRIGPINARSLWWPPAKLIISHAKTQSRKGWSRLVVPLCVFATLR